MVYKTDGRAFLGSAKAAWWSFLSSSLGGRAVILASDGLGIRWQLM